MGFVSGGSDQAFAEHLSTGTISPVGESLGFSLSGDVITPPALVADTAHVSVAGTVTANAAHGVLANDTDPIPNDMLTVTAVDGLASDVGQAIVGRYGTLTLNADGSYSYVADNSIPSNIIAQDIFTYTATEEAGGSATSTLTITITQPGQTYIAGTPWQNLQSGNGSVFLDASLLQNQTITAGNGNDAVIAGSNDTIVLGNNNDVVTAGSDSTITLGNGNDTVTAGANSTITLGNGNDTVTAGANSTITLGHGKDTIDLVDVQFGTATESYANGILTVEDAFGDVDKIKFTGPHTLADFHFANDGNGGTLITDPPVDTNANTAMNGANLALLVNHMASTFAGASDGPWWGTPANASAHINPQPLLTLPHA
jgi:VCBS repeat-containing protein